MLSTLENAARTIRERKRIPNTQCLPKDQISDLEP